MNKSLILALFFSVTLGSISFGQISLAYGEGSEKLAFINENRFPGLEEPVPYGPLSFRISDNHFWVADSVAGKIIKVDFKGKIVREFGALSTAAKKPKPAFKNDPCLQILIEDIAFEKGPYGSVKSVWVSDSFENKLIKIDTTGKILKEIKHPAFIQLSRIEIGQGGHIFVADKGAQKIFIFDHKYSLIGAVHWEWSGFAVSGADDKLHRVFFTEESRKLTLVTTDTKNIVLREIELELPIHLNPELWWVDEFNEDFVLTYTPKTGFAGKFVVVKIGFNGKVKQQSEMDAPIAMNRYIEHSDFEKLWIGKANFNEAPEGKFEIVPFKFSATNNRR